MDVRGRPFGCAPRPLRGQPSHEGAIAEAKPKPFSSALSSARRTSTSTCAGARPAARPLATRRSRLVERRAAAETGPSFGHPADLGVKILMHEKRFDMAWAMTRKHRVSRSGQGRPRARKRGGHPREALEVYARARRRASERGRQSRLRGGGRPHRPHGPPARRAPNRRPMSRPSRSASAAGAIS